MDTEALASHVSRDEVLRVLENLSDEVSDFDFELSDLCSANEKLKLLDEASRYEFLLDLLIAFRHVVDELESRVSDSIEFIVRFRRTRSHHVDDVKVA